MGAMDLRIEQERMNRPRNKPQRNRTRRSPSAIQQDKDLVSQVYEDYGLYLAAKNGNLDDFKRKLDQISAAKSMESIDILSRLSPTGSTLLHVAAKHGNEGIVKFIANMNPSLLIVKNFIGETVLHLAAKAGDDDMVVALIRLVSNSYPSNARYRNDLLMAKNDTGNTALLEALINGWDSTAEYMIGIDREQSYHHNSNGESALYLAAKAGFVHCVSLILKPCTNEYEERIHMYELFKKKSPIETAIKGKHRDVLDAIFNAHHEFIQLKDDEGMTPLHFAASLGDLEVARYLLRKYAHNATQRDKSGSFAIHLAASEGHVNVVSLLLQAFTDPEELVDMDGSNIFHLAAKNGRLNMFSLLLNNPNLEYMMNMKDKYGNTPLHLATKHWHPKIVNALTWMKIVDVEAVDNNGMTALDVAEHYMPYNTQYRQRLTWAALKSAGTPRSLSRKKVASKSKDLNTNKYKERVNTLLLVATLVATVTFAAGFTMPGGYISSDSGTDLGMGMGMATMLRHSAFHMFVFCDTIAMYSSIIVVVALIWAQLGDHTLILHAFTFAVPLLVIALIMMSVAFTAGVFVTVAGLRWLSMTILAMSISFVSIMLLLLIPLISPVSPRNRMVRYLSYYPFYLLLLASSS